MRALAVNGRSADIRCIFEIFYDIVHKISTMILCHGFYHQIKRYKSLRDCQKPLRQINVDSFNQDL